MASADIAFSLALAPRPASPWALVALAMGSFAIGTTEFLPVALLPTIAGDLSVSTLAAGLLVSGYALGVTVMTPVLAAAFSGTPRRGLLIGLMGFFALTNLLAALAPFYALLMTARVFTAFAHGVYFAAASTVAVRMVPPGREARAISLLFTGLTLAMATVVPMASLIGRALGWRAAFVLTALLGLAAMLAIRRWVPVMPPTARRMTMARQARALREPRLLLALAMTTVGYAGTFATFTYLIPILETISGFGPVMVTVLLALLGVGVTCGNLLGGRAADRQLHVALVGLYGLVAVSLVLFFFAAAVPWTAVAALLFFSVVMFSPGAGLQLLVVRTARQWLPGAEDVASGLNQSGFNLGIALGAGVGGLVVDSRLGLAWTPLVSAGLVTGAIGLTALAWCWHRRDARRLAASAADGVSARQAKNAH